MLCGGAAQTAAAHDYHTATSRRHLVLRRLFYAATPALIPRASRHLAEARAQQATLLVSLAERLAPADAPTSSYDAPSAQFSRAHAYLDSELPTKLVEAYDKVRAPRIIQSAARARVPREHTTRELQGDSGLRGYLSGVRSTRAVGVEAETQMARGHLLEEAGDPILYPRPYLATTGGPGGGRGGLPTGTGMGSATGATRPSGAEDL